MQQLEQAQISQVSGGDYFGPMFNSVLSGMSESEKALALTSFGVGVGVGFQFGKWMLVAALAGTGMYVGWDWYSSGEMPEELQPQS